MHQFSIITPAFNRAKYLPRIYNCLCQQGDADFEWIIVDDGSTDETKQIISSFKKTFELKYAYQENAGKPTAMNHGLQMADSYISISLDSDDILYPHVLKNVWNCFDTKTGRFEQDCVCIAGLCQYERGNIVGKKFPSDNFISDHIRCIKNRNIIGDKCLFYVTEILRRHPYPILKGEKHIAPGIVHTRIALQHKTMYVNQVFIEKQFLHDGLSAKNYWVLNPQGAELYYNETSVPPFRFSLQIRHSGEYIFFARMNRRKNIFFNSKNKPVFPLGILAYFIHCIKDFLKSFKSLRKINTIIKAKNKEYNQNHHKIIKE